METILASASTTDFNRELATRPVMEIDADSSKLCCCPVDARAHQRRMAALDYVPSSLCPRFASRLEPLELVAERGCWSLVLDGPSGTWTYEYHPRLAPIGAPHELRHVLHPAADAYALDEALLNALADDMANAAKGYDVRFQQDAHIAWARVGEAIQREGLILEESLWRDGRDLSVVDVLELASEDDDLTPWSSTTSPRSRVFYSDLPTVGKAVLDDALALIGRARDELRVAESMFHQGEIDENSAFRRIEDSQGAVGVLAAVAGVDPRDWYRRTARECRAIRKAKLPLT